MSRSPPNISFRGGRTGPSPPPRPMLPRARARSGAGAFLVVEDEALVALQIKDVLKGAGCEVLGPATSVAEATDLIDAARARRGGARHQPRGRGKLFDLRPPGLAGTPFAFCTGYVGAAELPERFTGVKALPKPLAPTALKRAVERLFAANSVPADPTQPSDS